MPRPRIFISHCGDRLEPTRFAARIISLLGCVPVIVEDQPELSRTVLGVVRGEMESCDSVVVIATRDAERNGGWIPSSSVTAELTRAQGDPRFAGQLLVVLETGVSLSPLNDQAYRRFDTNDLAPIAEALLVELAGMNRYLNYYSSPASELNLHEVADSLVKLRELRDRGVLTDPALANIIREQLTRVVQSLLGVKK